MVRIHSDGRCAWWPLFFFSESRCPVDVTWFPFDRQVCEVFYESYTLSTNHLNITAENRSVVPTEDYQDTGEWRLFGMSCIWR